MVNKIKIMQEELQRIQKELEQLRSKQQQAVGNDTLKEGDQSSATAMMMRLFMEDRSRTNKLLERLTEDIKRLGEEVGAAKQDRTAGEFTAESVSGMEITLSPLDKKILDFVQSRPGSMACADDVRMFLGYKGRNAACARLKKLEGILERVQVGHKAYYKFDAGKTTNTLIISPQQ